MMKKYKPLCEPLRDRLKILERTGLLRESYTERETKRERKVEAEKRRAALFEVSVCAG